MSTLGPSGPREQPVPRVTAACIALITGLSPASQWLLFWPPKLSFWNSRITSRTSSMEWNVPTTIPPTTGTSRIRCHVIVSFCFLNHTAPSSGVPAHAALCIQCTCVHKIETYHDDILLLMLKIIITVQGIQSRPIWSRTACILTPLSKTTTLMPLETPSRQPTSKSTHSGGILSVTCFTNERLLLCGSRCCGVLTDKLPPGGGMVTAMLLTRCFCCSGSVLLFALITSCSEIVLGLKSSARWAATLCLVLLISSLSFQLWIFFLVLVGAESSSWLNPISWRICWPFSCWIDDGILLLFPLLPASTSDAYMSHGTGGKICTSLL